MEKVRKRIFEIISIGNKTDIPSSAFDIFIVVAIAANLVATFMSTFETLSAWQPVLYIIEFVTCCIFLVEYVLRIITADFLYPKDKKWKAVFKFIFSVFGLIDLFAFLPFFLPFVFPTGIVAFRILRVIRIFRLFKLTSQYDAFQIIMDVLKEKRHQLLSSICLIMIIMLASSLIMYDLEHEAQPEAFQNAFSGIWWAVSAFLTVGYGDICPITTLGRIMGIVIAFLGVGMVAIPTGIISAGFVDYYSRLRKRETIAEEFPVRFITSELAASHPWVGQKVEQITLPPETILAAVVRKGRTCSPDAELVLCIKDILIIGEKKYDDSERFYFREILVKEENKWIGKEIRDLDISKLERIVSIIRKGKRIVPKENTVIKCGDSLLLFFEDMDAE